MRSQWVPIVAVVAGGVALGLLAWWVRGSPGPLVAVGVGLVVGSAVALHRRRATRRQGGRGARS